MLIAFKISHPYIKYLKYFNVGNHKIKHFFVPFRTLNHQYDYTFDWTMLKQKAAQQGASSGGQGQQAQTPTGKQTDKPKPNMKG